MFMKITLKTVLTLISFNPEIYYLKKVRKKRKKYFLYTKK